MKLTAAGDILVQKKINENYSGLKEIREFIEKGDARFFNFESTINEEGECFASQFSGGTYVRVSEKVFDSVKNFGFNMTSFNNNHIFDFSYEGLYKTIDAVNRSGLVHAGVGYNLAEASAPRYLETPNGRVALISVNTSFEAPMIAGEPSSRVKGRPGINGIRVERIVSLSEQNFENIKLIAKETGINAEYEADVRDGYEHPYPDDVVYFGNKIVKGDKDEILFEANKEDLKRVQKAIEEAKWAADEVIISIHTHQCAYGDIDIVPDFIKEFAHNCIDFGATAIVGHGPHSLRAIEVYKEAPIFYSLGDFVLQLYDVEFAPAEFYNKYSVSPNESIYTLLKTRSKDFTIGLMEVESKLETVIPYWETENGKLKYIELLPVRICNNGNKSDNGLPFVAKDEGFMNKLNDLSKQLGTEIVKENGKYICRW